MDGRSLCAGQIEWFVLVTERKKKYTKHYHIEISIIKDIKQVQIEYFLFSSQES